VAFAVVWSRVHPVSWRVVVADRAWRWWIRRYLIHSWVGVCARVGLTIPGAGKTRRSRGMVRALVVAVLAPSGVAAVSGGHGRPAVGGGGSVPLAGMILTRWGRPNVRVTGTTVRFRVRLRAGMDINDFLGAGAFLETAWQAAAVTVRPVDTATVEITIIFGDTLPDVQVKSWPAPVMPGVVLPAWVPVGRQLGGRAWRVKVGAHLLCAGVTGAGKGSVMWSLLASLFPYSHLGLAVIHGIDLKGGIELALGRAAFARVAVTAEQAVAILEDLVRIMNARLAVMNTSGIRKHVASRDQPLHVVVIDEFAALVASGYIADRGLRDRAETAINLLLSQGRAPGLWVCAFVQDPRADVVPNRQLFNQRIGLALSSEIETDMVLGDSATALGAACHAIPLDVDPTTPRFAGTGYALAEGTKFPVRVRADWVDDHMIRDLAQHYSCPARAVIPPLNADASPRSFRLQFPAPQRAQTQDLDAKDTSAPGVGAAGAGAVTAGADKPKRKRSPRSSRKTAAVAEGSGPAGSGYRLSFPPGHAAGSSTGAPLPRPQSAKAAGEPAGESEAGLGTDSDRGAA
ncbi:MAG: FtsK/SpoIIIE domain-containing protein, partial [Angustibacter sp.]